MALACLLAGSAAAQETKTVAVTAIVEHPALDAAREGIRAELAAGRLEEGQNLRFLFESAQGNPATAAQIARQLVGEAPDVIVPISTPSAQAVVAATRDIPVVFTAVTDPLGAKLVTSLEQPGGNVTGMSDLSPIGQHLDLVKEVLPEAASLGVIYNPGEANSLTLVELHQGGGAGARPGHQGGAGAEVGRRAARRRRASWGPSTPSTCRRTTRW